MAQAEYETNADVIKLLHETARDFQEAGDGYSMIGNPELARDSYKQAALARQKAENILVKSAGTGSN